MKDILTLVESRDQLNFFARCVPNITSAGYRMHFIMSKWSLHRAANTLRLSSTLVRHTRRTVEHHDLSFSGEVLQNLFTTDQASLYYQSFVDAVETVASTHSVGMVIVWGGGDTVASLALLAYAKKNALRTLYVDKGNLPGKMIVDPCGMNFDSYLFHHLSILDTPRNAEAQFAEFRKRLIIEAEQNGEKGKLTRNWLVPMDMLHSLWSGVPFRGGRKFIGTSGENSRIKRKQDETTARLYPKSYVFIPLNHSFEIGKMYGERTFAGDLIAEGKRIADERRLRLVVKFHPAENNNEFISYVRSLQRLYQFDFWHDRSTELIVNASIVVASNTSVALEAMIRGIPVQHVGKSLYRDMNKQRLANYVCWYLIDVEYGSDEPISREVINTFVSRAFLE